MKTALVITMLSVTPSGHISSNMHTLHMDTMPECVVAAKAWHKENIIRVKYGKKGNTTEVARVFYLTKCVADDSIGTNR